MELIVTNANGNSVNVEVQTGKEITLIVDRGIIGPQGPQGPQGPAGGGVPSGGTTGQVLAKLSNADQDAGWESLATVATTGAYSDLTGKPTLGTIASQNANNISITGGSISGTTVAGYQPSGTYVTSVSATSPVTSSGGTTPVIAMPAASTSVSGYLTNTDWNTFNSKTSNTGTVTSVAATAGTGIAITGSPITTSGTLNITNTAPDQTVVLNSGTGISVSGTYPNFTVTNTSPSSGGTVTSVTGTAPVVSSGGNTPAISMAKATGSVDGYLSATDWTTFNNKGTVSSVAATAGTGISITGSPITSSGTLNIVNTAPDQIVSLTGAGTTTVSGSYPNFTITSTGGSGGGDVSGPSSATDNAITRFDGTTGKLIQNSGVTLDDNANIAGIRSTQYSGAVPATQPIGTMWFDSATDSLNFQQNAITQQIGEELFIYGKASAAITDSPLQIIYHTGTVGASGVITFAPTVAGITDENAIIGVATESIANNSFGRITAFGVVHGINTTGSAVGETWANDDVIWYNPVTGNPTNVKPSAPNIKFQIGLVINAGSGGSGSFQVLLHSGTQLGGTDSNVQLTAPSAAQLLTYSTTSGYWKNTSLTAGTGISVGSASSGVLTVTNSAPDQTVAISSGTGISVTGTYPNFTVTNTSPSSGGTVTSVTATSPVTSTGGTTPVIAMPAATGSVNGYLTSTDWTTFNNKGSGTVTSITAGTGLSGGTITGSGTIAIDSTVATLSGTQTLTNKRVTPRVSTTTSSATPTINTDNVDMYGLTAQAVDITSFTTNLSGTPTDGQKLWIYIVGTGARAITWGSSFESSTATLPTTTVSTNRLDVGFVWNTATTKWRCVAVA